MALIVGLHGYARSGKDTVGAVLVEKAGFRRLAFADRMRAMLYAINPIADIHDSYGDGVEIERVAVIVDRIGWDPAKVEYEEIRELMQRLGTEGGRAILGEDVWVDATMRQIAPIGKYVITDVRFTNEAEAIRSAGGEVWGIRRPGTGPVNDHVSDQGIPPELVNRWIDNDGSFGALERKVLSVFTPA